jgi:hypothetical protein
MVKNKLNERDLWRKLLDPVRGWYNDGGKVEEDPSDEEILRCVVADLQADAKELVRLTSLIDAMNESRRCRGVD